MALQNNPTPTSIYTNNSAYPAVDQQTASYTPVIQDAGQIIESNSASANTVTIPPNSSVPFPIGTTITLMQLGAGQVAVAPGAGVTIHAKAGDVHLTGQYSVGFVTQVRLNEWYFYGDITT